MDSKKINELQIHATNVRKMALEEFIVQVPDIREARCLLRIFLHTYI